MPKQKIVQSTLIFLLLSLNVITQENFIDFESEQWDRANAQIIQFQSLDIAIQAIGVHMLEQTIEGFRFKGTDANLYNIGTLGK